jgi:hypothetical protein
MLALDLGRQKFKHRGRRNEVAIGFIALMHVVEGVMSWQCKDVENMFAPAALALTFAARVWQPL